MGQALYRKYRPRSFDEAVGQDHITTTIQNALKQGTIGHAYLFTGPRGTGKTSVARILAHAVNGLDYDDEASHLDIIEIDAASNRRIDEIRELRERVHTAPTSAKYKVYIIDEVHMLTREAFNALLKTLKEPPAHVIFILATTEAHKLPETIISRTQRFNFKPVEKEKVIKLLQSIAKSEKIDIDDGALNLIAEHGMGTLRDSVGLLDQVQGIGKQITQTDVEKLLGIPPTTMTEDIIRTLAKGDKKHLLIKLEQLNEQGFLAPQIAKQLANQLRLNMINGEYVLDVATTPSLLKQLLEVSVSHDPTSLLEIILLSVTLPVKVAEINSAPEPVRIDEPSIPQLVEAEAPRPKPKAKSNTTINDTLWQDALQKLKENYNTLYSIARIATPRFEDNELVLVVQFPFHQKRLNEARNKQIILEIVTELSGNPVIISCELDPKYKPTNFYNPRPRASSPKTDDTALDNISNIFGGGEVLE